MFEAASGLKKEFDSRYQELTVLPLDPKTLATKCNLYLSPVKNEKVDVEVARKFLIDELQQAKKDDNELRQVKLQKIIRDMYEVKEVDLSI